jgi:hypothetical protein
MVPPELLYSTLPKLRKELEQCKIVVYYFSFTPAKPFSEGLYPL